MAVPSITFELEYASGDIIGGRFELQDIVGEGGMGVVWSASDLQLCVDVAIKIMHRQLGETGIRRLAVEARATARVRHPGVVGVHHIGTTDRGDPYLVMELLEGASLDDVLEERDHLEQDEAVRLLVSLAEALGAAHDAGVVHRDIKPGNIYLAREGQSHLRPKLLDFGVARLVHDSGARLTVTGSVLGTPHFMSPEQASGRRDIDHRADLWALCAVAFELVTGIPPFDGDNYNAVLAAVLLSERQPFPRAPAIDPALREIILRGLRKDRNARWQSAWELRDALIDWLRARGEVVDATGRVLSEPAQASNRVAPRTVEVAPILEPSPARATLQGVGVPPEPIATTVGWAPAVKRRERRRPRWRVLSAALVATVTVAVAAPALTDEPAPSLQPKYEPAAAALSLAAEAARGTPRLAERTAKERVDLRGDACIAATPPSVPDTSPPPPRRGSSRTRGLALPLPDRPNF
jgi:serine/threonine-protein kinase